MQYCTLVPGSTPGTARFPPFPYPGADADGKMSLEYLKHHRTWTSSQNFRDQITRLRVDHVGAAEISDAHTTILFIYAALNQLDGESILRRLATRLLQRQAELDAMAA